ncbi:MAG: hypothetical protein Q9195_005716 [Heterodermia aff. obscurata]
MLIDGEKYACEACVRDTLRANDTQSALLPTSIRKVVPYHNVLIAEASEGPELLMSSANAGKNHMGRTTTSRTICYLIWASRDCLTLKDKRAEAAAVLMVHGAIVP